MRRVFVAAALAACSASVLNAQGALSLQGFGYPTGQASPRNSATAGAMGETDHASPINPAALPGAGRSNFSVQVDPEYRRMDVGGRTVATKTTRFPVISLGTRVGTRGFVGASFSTLLDRTWDASYSDSVRIDGQPIGSRVAARVRGAISDARVAYAWQFNERLQAGLAYHAYSGANRMSLSRVFDDTAKYGALQQIMTLSYAGSAFSAGVLTRPIPHLYLAASLRMGGSMRTRYDDSVATRGNAPNRYGVSLTYDGVPGTQFVARFNREEWSRMRSLGSSALDVRDADDLSVGAEIAGPKVQGLPTQFRFGARKRGLPFGFNGAAVSERTLAMGGGATFARGWASVDVSIQRNARKAGAMTEQGTILSVGITVRP